MNRQPECRIFADTVAGSGRWNMAVDEVLLESALADGICSLRLYRWSQPTLSLGYFQSEDDTSRETSLADLPRVRRLSGGGAILHHHELTYAIALPPEHALAHDANRLYGYVHRRVIEVLAGYGVQATRRGETAATKDRSFLCFARGDAEDVVARGHKILGSAQRRRRGAVLQHGSLILRTSPLLPAHPGLFDLTKRVVDEECLREALSGSLSGLLGERSESATLTAAEIDRAWTLKCSSFVECDGPGRS